MATEQEYQAAEKAMYTEAGKEIATLPFFEQGAARSFLSSRLSLFAKIAVDAAEKARK